MIVTAEEKSHPIIFIKIEFEYLRKPQYTRGSGCVDGKA